MDRESYWNCRRALDEAREALDTVATTSSPAVAAAGCRRALRLCCLLDRELNGTTYPDGFAPGPAIESLRARHPSLFAHNSILQPATILAAAEWTDDELSLGGHGADASLERVFVPAARSIRLMLDEVALNLRNPGRWSWRGYAAVLALGVILLAGRWAWMMASREGLTVTYYRDTEFRRPVARMVAKHVQADYGTSLLRVSHHRFSARWEGTLVAPVATNYEFYCQSEGGVRVRIDGDVVLDNWREVPWDASGVHGEKKLAAGDHAIVVEYFKSAGHGGLRLRWSGGPIPDNAVVGVPYLKR